uniref:Vinculin n=1 Tax=Heterorhabditis bacteriophora TaxID=37862 RepID=A0A1I7XF45_HETBA
MGHLVHGYSNSKLIQKTPIKSIDSIKTREAFQAIEDDKSIRNVISTLSKEVVEMLEKVVSVGEDQASLSKGRWTSAPHRKTAWSVFSTLTQGAHAVGEPRIVVETETATSIVRYTPNEGGKPYETREYTESELAKDQIRPV